MRPRYMVVVALVVLLSLIAAPAAVAKKTVEPVGGLHKLYYGEPDENGVRATSMGADTPFHIYHGHLLPEGDYKLSDYRLEIRLDGRKLQPDDVFIVNGFLGQPGLQKQWLFNFPDGLPAGEYIFEGTWTYPCESAVAQGFFEGPCLKEKRWTYYGNTPSGASLYQILTVTQ